MAQVCIIFRFLDFLIRFSLYEYWGFHAGWFRSFIADYGVPLMVVVWTALSFSVPGKVPSGVPRRLMSPLPWESNSLHHWTVAKVTKF